jgi:hypothetical protein
MVLFFVSRKFQWLRGSVARFPGYLTKYRWPHSIVSFTSFHSYCLFMSSKETNFLFDITQIKVLKWLKGQKDYKSESESRSWPLHSLFVQHRFHCKSLHYRKHKCPKPSLFPLKTSPLRRALFLIDVCALQKSWHDGLKPSVLGDIWSALTPWWR